MLTNNQNLPAAIVAAVENDPYDAGNCDISCTTLIGPPMIRHLREEHAEELQEDVADRIWALVGQAVHAVVERAAAPGELQEERLTAEFSGKRISGQFDLYDGETLTDLKVTSVWSIKAGVKPEWEAQLNVLAQLLREYGFKPTTLQIVAIGRDWRKNELLRYGADYPAAQVVTLPVKQWSEARTLEYIASRVEAHFGQPPEVCTAEERWDKPTTYAVMKNGRKSALRVCPTVAAAEAWVEKNGKGDRIVERPGSSPRCEQYCEVAQWCSYGVSLPKEEG